MIISIEQRMNKLIVSYVNKDRGISFTQIDIPPEEQFSYVYSRSARGIPGITSWDNKPIVKVPAQFLSRYRIQEIFLKIKDQIPVVFEKIFPKMYCCDIEVDVTEDGFAEAKDATNRINTISWCCYPDIIVFGLKDLSGEDCAFIEKSINEHIAKTGKKYNFVYKKYNDESDMLYDFLYNYLRHAPLTTGWNFWIYDWQYIYNRCKRLNLDISWLSPTKQWKTYKEKNKYETVEILLPQHKLIVDYQKIYKKWDKSVEVKENDSLEFVSEAVTGITKIKYPGTFTELYNKDFVKYVFYNAIDSILVELNDEKLKTMNIFLGLGYLTNVEAMDAFSPIAMLESSLVKYAIKRNQFFPKVNKQPRKEYEGAFVFEPIRDLYEWVLCFDFKSLYPHIMMQFMISLENFITKNKDFVTNENQIKCFSGAVFDATIEPLMYQLLFDYYTQRKNAKAISFKAEKEADELKKILKERKSKINMSLVN
jgi:DNA polymerase elongation subunit (family B)